MQQNKLQKTLSLYRKLIIAFIAIVVVIIVVATAISLTGPGNKITPIATQTPMPRITQPDTPQVAINNDIAQEWREQPKVEFNLGSGTRVQIPAGFTRVVNPDGSLPAANTYLFSKQITGDKEQFIQMRTEQSANKITVKEFLEAVLIPINENIETRYVTFAEKIQSAIAATTEYRLKDPQMLVVRTIIYTPPMYHEVLVAEDIGPNDTRGALTERLYSLRTQILENYSLLTADSDYNAINNDTEESALFFKHEKFYREERRQ